MSDTPDMTTPPAPGGPTRKKYVRAVGPRLRVLLTVVFALFALLGANSVYLSAITFLEWWRGLTYQNYFYMVMFGAHLVLGLLIVLPVILFGCIHIKNAHDRTNRRAVRVGYALFAIALLLLFSGLALMRFDSFSIKDPRVRSPIYWAHVITPVLAVWLYLLHRLAGPRIRWNIGLRWAAAVGVLVLAGVAMHSQHPQKNQTGPVEGTNYFMPSFARTATGKFIPARTLMMDDYCLKCHEDAYKGWFHSSHHFSSFNNEAYLFSVNETRQVALQRDGNVKASRWCAGCHDVVPLFSGAFDDPNFDIRNHPTAKAGITCTACHAITHVDGTRGNAEYTIDEPVHYPFAYSSNALLQYVNNQLVKAKPEFHKKTFLKPVMKSAEFCSTCHKVSLPQELTKYKDFLRGQNHYDTYLLSGVSGHNARSFYYPEKAQSNCNGCHMPLKQSQDFGANYFNPTNQNTRFIHDHFFPAANTGVPAIRKGVFEAQVTQIKNAAFPLTPVEKDIPSLSPSGAGLATSAQRTSSNVATRLPLHERAASLELAGGATRELPVTNRQHAGPEFMGTNRGFSRAGESLPRGKGERRVGYATASTPGNSAAELDAVIKTQEAFLKGSLRVDIFGLREGGTIDGHLIAPLRPTVPVLKRGQTYLIEVVLRTLRLGHPFTQGTVDSNEVWVDAKVTDPARRDAGGTLGRSGGLGAHKEVDAWSHFLNVFMLDRDGYRIDRRNPQDIFTPLYNHQIPPGAAQIAHYSFTVPPDAGETVQLEVKLNYRKFDTIYMNYVFGRGYSNGAPFQLTNELPITTIAADSITFPVSNSQLPHSQLSTQTNSIPLWQRWNDYGIGLFLEGTDKGAEKGELIQAAHAFEQVEKLGRYDGALNLARVYFKEGRLDEAVVALQSAAQYNPPAPRWTIAWLNGLVNKQNGYLDKAITEFRSILEDRYEELDRRGFDFSLDYEVINELGQTLFERAKMERGDEAAQKKWLQDAAARFQRTLELDAENVAAHYNLALINERLGRPELAAHHRKLHERYRPDDNARDRAVAAARRRDPAADHAAQATVIYPLQRIGAPGLEKRESSPAKTGTASLHGAGPGQQQPSALRDGQ